MKHDNECELKKGALGCNCHWRQGDTPPTAPIPGTIAATISDAELSALVATECAGWKQTHQGDFYPPSNNPAMNVLGHTVPSFATDANAILPLLEKQGRFDVSYMPDLITRGESFEVQGNLGFPGLANTFARATCFHLLKAKGFTVHE